MVAQEVTKNMSMNKKESKWNYGNAFLRYPIQDGETMALTNGRGKVKQHDLYEDLPAFILEADMMIIDPPWNLSNVNTFYTKADKQGEHKNSFNEFYHQIFKQIDAVDPEIIYIEIGKQNVDNFEQELKKRFKSIQRWPITYYKKHPCFFLRASKAEPTDFDYSGIDEWDAILKALEIEDYQCVADIVMGQGLVGVGAYTAGKRFVGTELNHKRLSVLMEKIANLGGEWEKVEDGY